MTDPLTLTLVAFPIALAAGGWILAIQTRRMADAYSAPQNNADAHIAMVQTPEIQTVKDAVSSLNDDVVALMENQRLAEPPSSSFGSAGSLQRSIPTVMELPMEVIYPPAGLGKTAFLRNRFPGSFGDFRGHCILVAGNGVFKINSGEVKVIRRRLTSKSNVSERPVPTHIQ
jgi:hypothetical protein